MSKLRLENVRTESFFESKEITERAGQLRHVGIATINPVFHSQFPEGKPYCRKSAEERLFLQKQVFCRYVADLYPYATHVFDFRSFEHINGHAIFVVIVGNVYEDPYVPE